MIQYEKKIVQKGHTALSTIARSLTLDEIRSGDLTLFVQDMQDRLQEQHDGVALAAPQLGATLRVFVVSPRVFSKMHTLEPLVYINPEIIKKSKEKKWLDEGCLSVRGVYGKTYRSSKVTVRAYNENGFPFTRSASGLLAQIFQHEIDHLNGVLFDAYADALRIDNDYLNHS